MKANLATTGAVFASVDAEFQAKETAALLAAGIAPPEVTAAAVANFKGDGKKKGN